MGRPTSSAHHFGSRRVARWGHSRRASCDRVRRSLTRPLKRLRVSIVLLAMGAITRCGVLGHSPTQYTDGLQPSFLLTICPSSSSYAPKAAIRLVCIPRFRPCISARQTTIDCSSPTFSRETLSSDFLGIVPRNQAQRYLFSENAMLPRHTELDDVPSYSTTRCQDSRCCIANSEKIGEASGHPSLLPLRRIRLCLSPDPVALFVRTHLSATH